MAPVTRIPLEGGGFVLVEEPGALGEEGPVQTGLIGGAVRGLPVTPEAASAPVTAVAPAAPEQLCRAGPGQIAKSQGGCHLGVTVAWAGHDRIDRGTEATGS